MSIVDGPLLVVIHWSLVVGRVSMGKFFFVLIFFLITVVNFLVCVSRAIIIGCLCVTRTLVLLLVLCLVLFCQGVIGPVGAVNDNVRLLERRSFDDQLDRIKRRRTSHIMGIFGHVVRRLGGRQLHLQRRGRFLSLVVGTSPVNIVVVALSRRMSRLGPVTVGVVKIHPRRTRKEGLSRVSSPLTLRLTTVPGKRADAIQLGSSDVCGYARSSFISHNFRRPFCLVRKLASRIVGTRGGTCRGIVHVVTRRIGGAATNVASALSAMRRTLSRSRNVRSVYSIVHMYARHYFSVDRFVAHFTSIIGVPRPHFAPAGLGSLTFAYGHFVRKVYGSQGVQLRLVYSRSLSSIGLSTSLFRRMLMGVVGGTTRDVKRSKRVVVHASLPATVRIISGKPNVSGRARTGLFDPFFSAGPGKRNVNLVFVHRILDHRNYAFSLHACTSKLAEFEVLFP